MAADRVAHKPEKGLIPLEDYEAPPMPAEHALRVLWRRLQLRLGISAASPTDDDSKLSSAPLVVLDDVAGPPACGPLLKDFDAAVAARFATSSAAKNLLVILPPCDDSHVIEAWARSRGFTTLEAPPHRIHEDPHEPPAVVLPHTTEGSLLVIPNLEHWFLRRRNGLVQVRLLLHAISQSSTPCLVACNSWAWAFLVKAASADLVLPHAMTFQPFDANRLARWFTEMANGDQTGDLKFLVAGSAENVFERNAAGDFKSTALQQLAARSLGIPWTAWHLWRQSIRTRDINDGKSPSQISETRERRIFWIAQIDDLQLPAGHEESALLVLHALLIHGSLSESDLAKVLPDASGLTMLVALERSGFITFRKNQWSANPEAYPMIRKSLKADGYPVGAI